MAVFIIGARTAEGWDFLFERYRTSLQMSVRSRMKTAMAFSPLKDKLAWWVLQATPPPTTPPPPASPLLFTADRPSRLRL